MSRFTVSVVLNGSRSNTRVSEATRLRIEEVADALGYRPNAIARGLVRRRIQVLGVFTGPVHSATLVSNPYASVILQGVMNGAAESGYDVLLFTRPWNGPASAREFADQRVDGVVLVAPTLGSQIVESLDAHHVPVVAISYPTDLPGVSTVDVDDAAGARLAVEHLVGLGHRRIAHLTGNSDLASAAIRRAGFVAAMSAAGAPVVGGMIRECAYDGSHAEGALARLMALPAPPTAIFAGNDTIAIAAGQAARGLGISLPRQLSIVGYDGTPSAEVVRPALTTVAQPLEEIGRAAARLLAARVQGEAVAAEAQLIAPTLVVRDSTAPPPVG